jgi:hypothetical protein
MVKGVRKVKINLQLEYAGQVKTFWNLEFDDETMSDESYQAGVDANNAVIMDNFLENFTATIERRR